MNFADIDTPVSDEELSGIDSENSDDIGAADPVVEDDGNVSSEPAVETPDPVADDKASDSQAEREKFIPRARFDELNAKLHQEKEAREALERRLAESERPQTAVENVDIVALEKEYIEAMMTANEDKAIEIRSKINGELFSRAEVAAAERVTKQLSERDAQAKIANVVTSSLSAYPFLDVESASANAEAIAEVVEMRDFYIFKGDPFHVALEKAVSKVGPSYATSQPAPVVPAVDSRKAAALARNAADAMRQPPAQVAGVGNRAAPIAPKVETQKDWEKLTQSERDAILEGS